MGVARYHRKIAYLLKVKPAYDAYERGRRALKRGDYRTARRQAGEALRIEPREALFSSLLGDALAAAGDQYRAMTSYNDAVSKDPGFFRHYLQRGRLALKLGRRGQARQDLEKSLDLLPTAEAYHDLGQLALGEGKKKSAVCFFRKAAGSRSKAGKAAAMMLHRLDLPAHPGRYLKTSLKQKKGCIEIVIRNPTSVPVTRLDLVLKNRKHKRRFTVLEVILPGKCLKYQTDVKIAKRKELYRWWVTLDRAVIGK